jgi:hypothetical protein
MSVSVLFENLVRGLLIHVETKKEAVIGVNVGDVWSFHVRRKISDTKADCVTWAAGCVGMVQRLNED